MLDVHVERYVINITNIGFENCFSEVDPCFFTWTMTTNIWLWQLLTKWVTPCVSHYIHYKIEICIFLNWSACEVREHSYGFHWLRKARKHRFRHSHSLNFDIHNFLKTTGFSLFYMINIDVDRVVFSTLGFRVTLGNGLAPLKPPKTLHLWNMQISNL